MSTSCLRHNGEVSAGINTWVWVMASGLYEIDSITVTLDGVPGGDRVRQRRLHPVPLPAQPGTFRIGATATGRPGHVGRPRRSS